MTIKQLLFGLPVAAASLGLVACDVETVEEGDIDLPTYEQTREGNLDLPDVDVQGGDVTLPEFEKTGDGDIDLPEIDVTTPDVDVNSGTETIEVPTVDVDIAMPDEQDDAMKMPNTAPADSTPTE